jgi:hypothetical protein
MLNCSLSRRCKTDIKSHKELSQLHFYIVVIIFLQDCVIWYSYCECFAAGLYCIEPCSCLECSNNPAHEDTVLETRRQIESRNPLAFAPKVIRNSDSVSEFGVGNSPKLHCY